jgi:hypothetical protein
MHYRINICTFAILTDIWKLYDNLIFQRIQRWRLNCICILQSVTIPFGTPHEFLGGPWAQLTCITWFTGLVGRHRAELHETGAFPRPRAGGHGETQECPSAVVLMAEHLNPALFWTEKLAPQSVCTSAKLLSADISEHWFVICSTTECLDRRRPQAHWRLIWRSLLLLNCLSCMCNSICAFVLLWNATWSVVFTRCCLRWLNYVNWCVIVGPWIQRMWKSLFTKKGRGLFGKQPFPLYCSSLSSLCLFGQPVLLLS